MNKKAVIEVKDLATYFGDHCVHENLNLTVNQHEILAIVGGSGSGKTTLLRDILLLQRPSKGSIVLLNEEMTTASQERLMAIRRRIGVMFQQGALFTSLTILENILFPIKLHIKLPPDILIELGMLKLALVGLPTKTAYQYPAELSGGMIKRAAVARALAMDPELLFLDEPTAGLDPHSASALDEMILELRDNLGLTIVLVTHDLDTLWRVTDKVAFLGEKHVLATAPMRDLATHEHPLIQEYFKGPRARMALLANGEKS